MRIIVLMHNSIGSQCCHSPEDNMACLSQLYKISNVKYLEDGYTRAFLTI